MRNNMSVRIPNNPIPVENFVSGKFQKGAGPSLKIISPYNGKVIGEMNSTTAAEVDVAVKAAKAAQAEWAQVPLKERTKVMFNFRQILMRDIDEIAHIKSSESGKAFAEGKAGLMKGIEVLEFAIALQNMDVGGKVEVSRGVSCEYR